MTFSIGDVLEQLHSEFPDITVSKIRFLESQGLIAPMRTASGFRMFSEIDISKLKWILAHQRDRFLPLKVIKEYLAKLSDEDFADGNSPSFDFETSGTLPLRGNANKKENENKSNVQVLDPPRERSHLSAVGSEKVEEKQDDDDGEVTGATIRTLVQNIAEKNNSLSSIQEAPFSQDSIITRTKKNQESKSKFEQNMHPIRIPGSYDSHSEKLTLEEIKGATQRIAKSEAQVKRNLEPMISLEKMTIETGIAGPVLKELVRYSILDATGEGNAIVFDKSQIDIALIAGKLLDLGIEPRLLKTYVLFAGRELGYLEFVTQDDLRKRNPEAIKAANEKAIEFIQQTAMLKELLLLRAYHNEEN